MESSSVEDVQYLTHDEIVKFTEDCTKALHNYNMPYMYAFAKNKEGNYF